jgi:hypothetical protein
LKEIGSMINKRNMRRSARGTRGFPMSASNRNYSGMPVTKSV